MKRIPQLMFFLLVCATVDAQKTDTTARKVEEITRKVIIIGDGPEMDSFVRREVPEVMMEEEKQDFPEEEPAMNKAVLGIRVDDAGGRNGASVTRVLRGGGAEKAGLEPGDIILRVRGAKIHDADELVDRLSGLSPGDKVKITFLRSGESFRKTVTMSGPSDIREPTERREGQKRMNKERKIILQREIRDTMRSQAEGELTLERSIRTEGSSRKLNVSLSSSSPDTDRGRLDIRFEGARMPLSVKVLDPDGREVFSDGVDDDSGRYERLIEVKMVKGTTLVQVWQAGKCSTVRINVE